MIAAAPERVWALVSDVTRTGEWSPENVGGTWLDGARGPAVRARFRGSNRRAKRSATGSAGGRRRSGATAWNRCRRAPGDGSFELVRGNGAISRLITRLTIGVRDRRADLEEGAGTTLANLRDVAEAGA